MSDAETVNVVQSVCYCCYGCKAKQWVETYSHQTAWFFVLVFNSLPSQPWSQYKLNQVFQK